MLVKDLMRREVTTIEADSSMLEATDLCRQHELSLLPVMKKGRLIGVLTDGDLKRASASEAISLNKWELQYLLTKIKVSQIMNPKPITVNSESTLAETAALFLKNKIDSAPVVDRQGRIVGLIGKKEIFKLVTLMVDRNFSGLSSEKNF